MYCAKKNLTAIFFVLFANISLLEGFMVGLAIPLWQNKNVAKQVRAEALSSESMAEDSRVRYYNHLRSLYNQAVGLHKA